MKPLATQHVLVNGSHIAYGIYGQGRPVILLHGTPSSSLIWRDVVSKLVSAGFKVHVYDLLGFGLSERPWDPSVDTSMTGQISSHTTLGGGIAQRLAVFSPHLIRSLTLIDVVSFDSYPSPRTREQMARGLERLAKTSDSDHRAHFREWLLSAVVRKDKFAASSLDSFLDYISGPVGQPSLFEHQVRHYDPKHTMEVAPRLGELAKLPVQLIWGADDAWQVLDWAHKLNEAIPNSKLEVLKECGHFSPEDQPEKISELLVRFIGDHA